MDSTDWSITSIGSGNMKQCGGFMAIDKRLEVFENVVSILCSRDRNIILC